MSPIRRSALMLSAPVLGVALRVGSPPAESVGEGREVIFVNVRGTGPRAPSEPGRLAWTVDVYSMATGEKIGTATHDIAFRTPGFEDRVITFHLPDGQIVDHALQSMVPDPARNGYVLVGVHPTEDTIVPEQGTGAYAGRTGRARQAGWHGDATSHFPDQITLDDFYAIELEPR